MSRPIRVTGGQPLPPQRHLAGRVVRLDQSDRLEMSPIRGRDDWHAGRHRLDYGKPERLGRRRGKQNAGPCNSVATSAVQPVNVTPEIPCAATHPSSMRLSDPSPTMRIDHPSSASRDACQAARAVSVSFSGSNRCSTRTLRFVSRQRHGGWETPERMTAAGGRSRLRAMNSLTAISRAMPDAIHGAPMRPTRWSPCGPRIAECDDGGAMNPPCCDCNRLSCRHLNVAHVPAT